ncbi:hypothetical protein VDS41_16200 [Xanthomonas campestris pv. campestris]|nr:hypothetical protein [Xanthomonas campestris pv. campestris]
MDNNACLGAYADEGAARGEGSGRWPRGARSEASALLAIGSSSRTACKKRWLALHRNNESPSLARVL